MRVRDMRTVELNRLAGCDVVRTGQRECLMKAFVEQTWSLRDRRSCGTESQDIEGRWPGFFESQFSCRIGVKCI